MDASITVHINEANMDGMEIHACAISDIAQFTALSIELFHRIAELLLVKEVSNFERDIRVLSRLILVNYFLLINYLY